MEKMARDMCLTRRMEHMMTDIVWIWKRMAQKRLFLPLEYDLTASRTMADDDTEPGEQLKMHTEEAQVKL